MLTVRILVAVAFAGSLLAQQQRFEFHPVKREVLEARLETAPEKQKDRGPALRALFEAAGCAGDRLSEQEVKHVQAPNLICTAPGETDSEIVIGAHFDFDDHGRGVIDNWSGASMLASLYEAVSKTPRRHRFVFVGFAAEELAMVGSQAFVKALDKDHKERIRAMVNLDSIGLTPTKVAVSGSDKRLVEALGTVARAMKLPLEGVNVQKVGSSDSESFVRAKIPAIDIHSLTQQTWPILHSGRDTIRIVDRDAYWDTYRLVLGYLVFLDKVLTP